MRRLLYPLLTLIVLLPTSATAWAQTLTVFAASSLTDAFGEIGDRFETTHPGVRVRFNFAGSSTLATQLLQGARADLFASADARQLERVADDRLLDPDITTFAGNTLVLLAAAASGPGSVAALADPGLLLVLAAPEVPAGGYARRWLADSDAAFGPDFESQVLANLVSNEPNVRQAAAKVALGEADAALVYRSDALGLADVRVLPLPDADALDIRYGIAPLRDAGRPRWASEFVTFLLSLEGQAVLERHGFAPPP
jgi:molybdate transport system substrate-binding protein